MTLVDPRYKVRRSLGRVEGEKGVAAAAVVVLALDQRGPGTGPRGRNGTTTARCIRQTVPLGNPCLDFVVGGFDGFRQAGDVHLGPRHVVCRAVPCRVFLLAAAVVRVLVGWLVGAVR